MMNKSRYMIFVILFFIITGCSNSKSDNKIIVPGLEISFTSNSPLDQGVASATECIVSHLILEAIGTSDVSISSITINATGSGNDCIDISLVEIYLDVDNNDIFDPGTDAITGSGNFDSDNGKLTVNFGSPQIVSTAESRNWFIRYQLNGNGPDNATYAYNINTANDIAVKYVGGLSTSVKGLPLTSSELTVVSGGAKLNLLSGSNPPSDRDVLKGMTNIPVMQFSLYNRDTDNISVDSIEILPAGSGDDSSEVLQGYICVDENGNGNHEPLETVFGSYIYATDNTPVNISGNYTITSNTRVNFLVVYDFDSSAVIGSNFQAVLFETNDIHALDVSFNNISPTGTAPLQGAVVSVVEKGSLFVGEGAQNPGDGDIRTGCQDIPVLQIGFEAGSIEDILIDSISLHATGSANDLYDITEVKLYADNDNNGLLSETDTEVSNGSFAGDNGIAALSNINHVVGSGQKINFLASVSIPATAQNSSTFRTYIDSSSDISATGVISGLSINTTGSFPIQSGLMNIRVSDSFIAAGNMDTARFMHTQTSFLDPGDGRIKVLVCGGYDGSQILDSAEIYDPQLNTWTNLSVGMTKPRMLHTATLLSDGQQILIAGGTDGNATTYQDGEIFNPATYSFSSIENIMMSKHHMHTAVLTNQDKVFLYGGQYIFGSPQYTQTTESYNPASNRFEPVSLSGFVRILHTMNSLEGGTVIVTGGLGYAVSGPRNTVLLKSIQLWSTTPTISEIPSWLFLAGFGRCGHVAISMPGGYLLIAGGYNMNLYVYTMPPFSGRRKAEIISENSTVVGDEIIRDVGDMAEVRFMPVGVLLPNGKVLIAGGADDSVTAGPLDSAELYDPVAETFNDSSSFMIQGRYRAKHSIIAGSDGVLGTADDLVLITGGLIEYAPSPGPPQITSISEIYVP